MPEKGMGNMLKTFNFKPTTKPVLAGSSNENYPIPR
jgi:hypothetical protein